MIRRLTRADAPWLALAGAMSLLLTMRLALFNDWPIFGDDMASYLMTKNWVASLGSDPVGFKEAHFRPPLVGVLLLLFTWLWGDLGGSKVLALLVSVLVAVPAYRFARYWLNQWPAVIVSVLLMADLWVASYAFTGYLAVIALGLTLWALRELLDILDGRGAAWRLVLAVFLLVGFNQTAVPIVGVVALVFVAIGTKQRRALRSLAWAGLASLLWYYPFYSVNIPFGERMTFGGVPAIQWYPVEIYSLYAFPVVALVVAGILFHSMDRRWWLLAVPGVLFAVLSNVGLSDVAWNNVLRRTAYLLPPIMYLSFAYFLKGANPWPDNARLSVARRGLVGPDNVRHDKARQGTIAALGLAAIVGLGLWWNFLFGLYAENEMHLKASWVDTARAIERETPRDSYIMAHPRGLAYWIGALGHRQWEGTWGMPIVEKQGEDAARQCAFGWRDNCDRYELRDVYGVDYMALDPTEKLYLDGRPFAGEVNPDKPWLREVYRSGSVTVYVWQPANEAEIGR